MKNDVSLRKSLIFYDRGTYFLSVVRGALQKAGGFFALCR